MKKKRRPKFCEVHKTAFDSKHGVCMECWTESLWDEIGFVVDSDATYTKGRKCVICNCPIEDGASEGNVHFRCYRNHLGDMP